MVGGIASYLREYYDFPKFCEQVAQAFQQHGFVSKRDVHRQFFRNMRQGFELDRVIDQLKKQGRIEFAERAPRTGGPTATGWKWIEEE